MTKKKRIIKDLIWVYPPRNWISNFKRTFVYGWSNPKARLYVAVSSQQSAIRRKEIKTFPNGNFAQMVKLPHKKNAIKLIQILNGKKKTKTRIIKTKRRNGETAKRQITPPRCSVALLPRRRFVIVIDPGHGGKEQGTHSPKGVPEKIFNLQIAKLLFNKLKKHNKNVYLTRTADKFVSLKQRVNFAKKKKCNLLISIHHNALPDNEDPLKHRGVGVYYTHDFVKPLAKKLLFNISKESGLKKYGIFKRDFALTRPDFCHAVLIECGFLIHPVESEIITQRKVQEKIARGIVKALL